MPKRVQGAVTEDRYIAVYDALECGLWYGSRHRPPARPQRSKQRLPYKGRATMLEKILNALERSKVLAAHQTIAFSEFESACASGDEKAVDDARLKLHELLDQNLDFQREIFKLKNG